ncbi:MAG: hypothetical protein PHI68_05985 [Candidatus Cloacimonetes bacterium]|nr:hypothetical protein [Candidatus Cloacimonadota bacterium]
MNPLVIDSNQRIVAIVGLCKNAGKTTLLNHIIRTNPYPIFGVMSTGRDGERHDSVSGHRKPEVKLGTGTLFVCDTLSLDLHLSKISVLAKLPWKAGNRELWIAQALQELETEIFGPANVSAQIECAHSLLSMGAQNILIDGSIDRKSIALSSEIDSIYLVAGASFGSTGQIVDELRKLLLLNKIELYPADGSFLGSCISIQENGLWHDTHLESILGHERELIKLIDKAPPPQSLFFPGALSERSFRILQAYLEAIRATIVVSHPYNLSLSYNQLEQLLQTNPVYALKSFKIRAIALNPWTLSPPYQDPAEFRDRICREFPEECVFDVMDLK